MFVRLGSAYHPHRAHVVRGLLEAHGIPVEVWHEEAAHLYTPGWQPCSVMIPEDQAEAAMEVMNARPEEPLPEESTATEEAYPPFQKYPTFLDWLILGAMVPLLWGASEVLGHVFAQMERPALVGSHTSDAVNGVDVLKFLVIEVPLTSLCAAVLATICMAPLKIWDGDRWMGMIAYLFVRWLLPFLLVGLTIAWSSQVR